METHILYVEHEIHNNNIQLEFIRLLVVARFAPDGGVGTAWEM